MKITTAILTVILFIVSHTASAQFIGKQKPERDVPNAVAANFTQRFPQADPVWFSSYQGRYDQRQVYEARFLFDNRYSMAIFDKEGNFIAFAATVTSNEVPQKAIQYMKDNFPTYPILDSILVTRINNDVTYELGIMVDEVYIIKVFSESGDFIRSTRA